MARVARALPGLEEYT